MNRQTLFAAACSASLLVGFAVQAQPASAACTNVDKLKSDLEKLKAAIDAETKKCTEAKSQNTAGNDCASKIKIAEKELEDAKNSPKRVPGIIGMKMVALEELKKKCH